MRTINAFGTNGPQTNFFFQRTTKIWNDLPASVVEAENVNQFKNRLDEFWKHDALRYDHTTTDEINE